MVEVVEMGLSIVRAVLPALLIAGGIYVVVLAAMFVLQPRLMYFPWREITETPADHGAAFSDVWLTTTDGVRVHGWWLPADQAQAHDNLTVLFCHGNAGNLTHRASIVSAIAAQGINVLVFDYRGYGLSDGEPTEEGTYRDAEAAWDWLVDTQQIRADQIVLMGRSLGGAVAAWLAMKQQPRALVLESAFTSVRDVARKHYPWLPASLARYDYSTAEYVHALNCPVFITHSDKDEVIPYELGRRLYDAVATPKRFYEKSGGHNDGFLQPDLPGSESRMQSFVRFVCDPLGVTIQHDDKTNE
jgi:uncharacterized protein